MPASIARHHLPEPTIAFLPHRPDFSLIMASTTTPPTSVKHPITWTEETPLKVLIRPTDDVPIDKLLEGLDPKWLVQGVTLENALHQACPGHEAEIGLRWAKNRLREHQHDEVWLAETVEERITSLCTSWLVGLNEPRELRRYRSRSV